MPTLASGVAASGSLGGAGRDRFYKIEVPEGRPSLTVVLDGEEIEGCIGVLESCEAADLDLYVKRGVPPTDDAFDCRRYAGGNNETCTLTNPASDWWFIRIKVYSGQEPSDYEVTATY